MASDDKKDAARKNAAAPAPGAGGGASYYQLPLLVQYYASYGRYTFQRMFLPNRPEIGPQEVPQGWTIHEPRPAAAGLDSHTRLILQELGIAEHENGFKIGENRLIGFGALYYQSRYNPDCGTIIVDAAYGHVTLPPSNQEFNAPDRWSDLSFPMWRRACGNDPRRIGSLRYVIQRYLINMETVRLVDEIIPGNVWSARRHAVHFTPANGDIFFALLHAPSIIGAAYLSINYPNSLHGKTVRIITPYFFQEIGIYYLVMELG